MLFGGLSAASDFVLRPAYLPSPRQGPVPDAEPWSLGTYTVTPLASYEVDAVVLASRSYRGDREADASPLDLALGWGAMADVDVIASFDVSQQDRWYYVRWTRSPLATQEIVRHSANTHILPATDDIQSTLEAVRPGDFVRLRGYLVELSAPDGWRWRSSLTRDDTGAGACEVLWVESVEVIFGQDLWTGR